LAKRAPAAPRGRRQVAAARTREEILVAAAHALARRGFESVSMREIAREVGFTAPALYAYFDSKKAIFDGLAQMMADELTATFQAPSPGGDFRARVTALMRRQLEWVDRRRDAFAVMFAVKMGGHGIERPSGGGPLDHLERLTRWVRAATAPGDLGSHTPEDTAALLMGVGQGFFMRWVNSRDGSRLADQTERIIEFFFHGLAGPPAGRRKRRGESNARVR
jgi:AcrR family transcriptional regulator